MSCKSITLVLACALFACALGQTTTEIPTTKASTTESPPTSSSEPPSTKTPPIPPTTPSTPPTTASPPTTTPNPPTTPPTPPTTPPTPPTTSPSPVTTTAAPPSDGRGNWTVSDGNVTCIVAQMVVAAKISYALETPNKTNSVEVTVPVSAKAEGVCGPMAQDVTLTWGSNNIKFSFVKNDTIKMYMVDSITLSIYADNNTFPNITSDLVNTTIDLKSSTAQFKTNVDQSFRCIREQSLPLNKPNSSHVAAVLELNKVQVQAFREKADAMFGTAQDCELDTPDIIPIAVGCALAALVFVVLVAYLVGRRRAAARGYLSIFLD